MIKISDLSEISSTPCWGSHLRQRCEGARTRGRRTRRSCALGPAKALKQSDFDEGPGPMAQRSTLVRHDGEGETAKAQGRRVTKRRRNEGLEWRRPSPKSRLKTPSDEGPGARQRPTCRASCNPLVVCKHDITREPMEYSVIVAVGGQYGEFAPAGS